MASASDNFNRANENPLSDGGNWSTGPGASSDIQLVNNRVRNVTTQTESVARRGSPTFAADQAAEIAVVTRNSTEDYGGPAVRINSSDADHYFLRPAFTGTTLQIRRVDDTGTLAGTTLGASFGTFALNDVLRLEAIGSLLIAKQNGTILATRVDTTYATGQPGISLWNNYTDVADLELDNWSAEDLTKTRLYLPSSGASPINFSFASGWEKTSEADRISAVTAKSNTALTDKTCSENVATTPYDVLARQYCYGPLAAQTIAGTVRGIIRVRESNAQADFRAQLVIKVMASDGSTVRGTLLDFDTQALKNEFPTTAASRMFPLNWDTVALTSVSAQSGDYLVIEIGIRSHNSSTTNRTATFRFGDPTSGSDFTEAEGTTTDNVPWLEFDSKLILQPLTPNVASPDITVTEDHRAHILIQPLVASPTISVTESSTVEIQSPAAGGLTVDVFDAVAVAEFHHEAFVIPTIGESITVQEGQVLNLLVFPTASSDVGVTDEGIVLLTSLNPEAADSITVSESHAENLLLLPRPFDSVLVEEIHTLNLLLQPQPSDTIAVEEAHDVDILIQPQASDTVTLDDVGSAFLPNLGAVVIVDDGVTVSESHTLHLLSFVSIIEPIFLDELVALHIRIEPQASSSITVEESQTIVFPVYLYTDNTDSVTLADEGTVALSLPLLPISTFDALTIEESINLMFPLNNPVFDGILVEDAVGIELAGGTLEVSVYDEIGALTAVGRLPALTLIE